ncbi:GNAT family N-acetyltransferase [Kribbella sp. CA-293567]|uniref:GNAT family N-acetyltransferase n=1 Tax=Kribbella sp. CA-293567 TaxID=3002436 RepID=UPI0022DD13F6|nr:GNAT family N-acetyltransferase [Kribbella sp. CA-293567]WBQ02117.1 GNAT family N-acetyltransferase [Kribbella sp. CA-293567]
MNFTSLGYRTDLMLLQLSGSVLTDQGDYVVVRTPANPTFWWGNYLLFRTPFAPGDAVAREAIFRQEFPAAKHLALGLDTVDGVVGSEDEVKALGLEIDRNTVMTAREVREPARPNLTSQYRDLSSDDDWEQLLDLSLACATMTVDEEYREFSRRRIEAERGLCGAGHARWFGAFDGERLQASLGLASDGSGVARFQNVQTRPEDRNQGIASTLVHRASRYGFDELGAHTLVMVADPGYLAIRIYRALGFDDNEVQLGTGRAPATS